MILTQYNSTENSPNKCKIAVNRNTDKLVDLDDLYDHNLESGAVSNLNILDD